MARYGQWLIATIEPLKRVGAGIKLLVEAKKLYLQGKLWPGAIKHFQHLIGIKLLESLR